MKEVFTPYLGVYQVGVLSPLLRIFYKNNTLLAHMDNGLKSALVYGFYTTGWGAIYLDCGLLGAVIFIVGFGFISGYTGFRAKNRDAVEAQLLSAFCYTSILMSVFNGPFGMANSFLVFISILAVAGLLKRERVRHAAQNTQWVLS